MKVRTCRHCPYTPSDLGLHYAADAKDLCCLDCPHSLPVSAIHFPRPRHNEVTSAAPNRMMPRASGTAEQQTVPEPVRSPS